LHNHAIGLTAQLLRSMFPATWVQYTVPAAAAPTTASPTVSASTPVPITSCPAARARTPLFKLKNAQSIALNVCQISHQQDLVTDLRLRGRSAADNSLIPCPNSLTSTGGVSYCCGFNNQGCCDNGTDFPLPVGQVMLRASQITALGLMSVSITGTSSVTTTSRQPSTISSSASTTQTSILPSLAVTSTHPATSNTKALAIGLGVGVPLFLILVSVLLLLFWELRRHNTLKAAERPDNAEIWPTSRPLIPADPQQGLEMPAYHYPVQQSPHQVHQVPEAASSPVLEMSTNRR
jgi:hypothetical protein